ncbi:MAG: tRNA lysidine(34) synthetase TilS [Desulforegulaceae bacterium]|nr:tRNA lysidine(34) synthetase TilS [Desulforegulaceae bacterium]
MKSRFEKLIEKKLINKFEFKKNESVLLAFSGGPDSVFLLYHLHLLSEKYKFKIGAFHLNHCLRGKEADKDAQFCKKFCKELGIEFFYEKKDIKKISKELKISEEDAGRKKRYDLLNKISQKKGFKFIATAHHKDDSIEQVLMNFLRGTGIDGLSGIPEKRNNIIRPLLDIDKNQIIDFLEKKKINYCIDKTNFEADYLRNKIRNVLIPYLEKEFNPSIKKGIANLIDISDEENRFIENYINNFFSSIVKFEKNKALIDLEVFNQLEKAIKRRVLRKTIKSLKGTTFKTTLDHIDKIIEISLLEGRKQFHLKDRIIAEKYFETLELKLAEVCLRNYKPESLDFNIKIEKLPEKNILISPDKTINFKIYTQKEDNTKSLEEVEEIRLNPKEINFPLILRNLEKGDRFSPKNFKGRKKIKKILAEKKLSPDEKKKIAVLESREKIYWISGVAKNHFNALPLKGEKTLVIKRILM